MGGTLKRVGLLVVVVVVFGGCTSDGDSPSETRVRRSSSPAPRPTASPSPEFEVGQAIKPKVVFKGQISASDRAYVKRTVERAFAYFKVPHPAGAPVMRYAEIYGKRSPYASEARYCGQLTDAGGIQIYLYACSEFGRNELTSTIVHEVFHAMQNFTRDTYRQGIDAYIDGQYPKWFDEGSATWVAAKVLDDWGVETYAEERAGNIAPAQGVEATLEELELSRVWFKRNGLQEYRQYGLSFFGVEKALDGRDWRAALEVYQRAFSHPVPRWDQAFKKTFGISMKTFYKRFDGFYESGFAR